MVGRVGCPAVNASELADGNAMCECCPSLPFYAENRYYDLVRNNNGNIRDFWLMSSPDGITWDGAVDVDPLDWDGEQLSSKRSFCHRSGR